MRPVLQRRAPCSSPPTGTCTTPQARRALTHRAAFQRVAGEAL